LDVTADKGRVLGQALNCRPLTVESPDQFQASTRGSFGGQCCTGTDFCSSTSECPCQ